jgi:hypothetical protein
MTDHEGADVLDESYEPEQLVLSDLINRVLDKGVVISAEITISVADVDLIQLDLKVLLSGLVRQRKVSRRDRLFVRPPPRP